MLNIFTVSQIRTTSSCGYIYSEYHAPNLLFSNIYRAKENLMQKVFWQFLCLLFKPKTAVTHRPRQLFPLAWVCQLAQWAPWEGFPAPSSPTRDPHAADLVAALRAETWPVSSEGLQGVPAPFLQRKPLNRVFLAYYSLPAANINNRSSTEKIRC